MGKQVQFFKALSHPTRLAILNELREEEQCVCHLEAALELRQAHISQHLMVLREAGLVIDRREGWNIYYRVSQPGVFAVIDSATALSGQEVKRGNRRAGPLEADKRPCLCPKCIPNDLDAQETGGLMSPGALRVK